MCGSMQLSREQKIAGNKERQKNEKADSAPHGLEGGEGGEGGGEADSAPHGLDALMVLSRAVECASPIMSPKLALMSPPDLHMLESQTVAEVGPGDHQEGLRTCMRACGVGISDPADSR